MALRSKSGIPDRPVQKADQRYGLADVNCQNPSPVVNRFLNFISYSEGGIKISWPGSNPGQNILNPAQRGAVPGIQVFNRQG